jgi:polyisoprenoid-binding protein YceI
MKPPGVSVLLAIVSWAGAAVAASPYVLSPEGSQVVIHVGKAGVFSFAGHEHRIVAGPVEGTVVFDAENLARSTVEVRFQASGLRVTGQGEPKDDVPKVQEAMLGPKCLDAPRFPTIRFASRTVTVGHASAGHDDLVILGDLTLHGVTRPVTVPVAVDLLGDRLTARGRMTVRQTDFGITPITVAGVVKVKDELVLEWTLEGRRAQRPASGPVQ